MRLVAVTESSWVERALQGGVLGVWRWQVDDDRITWSDSAKQVLRAEQLDGSLDTLLALLDPEDRQRLEQALRRAVTNGGSCTCEFRLADDKGRWIELSGRREIDPESGVQLVGWVHDASSRKTAEDALVQLAARVSATDGQSYLRSLVEHLAVVLGGDVAFVATHCDADHQRVRTVAMWQDGQHTDDFEYDLSATPCDKVMHQGVCVFPSGVHRMFPRDPMLVEMGIEGYAGVPIFDRADNPLGLLVVLWRGPVPDPRVAACALEIFGARAGAEFERQAATARQRMGADLLERQNKALAELSRSPLWQASDRDALLRQITELGARTLGVDRVGTWLFDAETSKLVLVDLYERDHDRHSRGLELGREGAEAYFAALGSDRVIAAHDAHTDPRTREFAASYLQVIGIASMLDAPIRVHGSTVGVVCCEHLGQRREWLPEEESFSGSLADFAGLAIDLAHRRALEEQLLQKQSLESIGRLAGGVAHDFNNLLTAISGSAELARVGLSRSQNIEAFLTEIVDASQRAAELTSQLLGFARKRVIAPKVVDLNEVVQRANRMLQRLIGEHVVLETKLERSLWKVRVDPGQFEQILVNLAVNGRDAMPQGGRLLIETSNRVLSAEQSRRHPDLGAADHVMLAVSDTGVGIAKDVLPHIFEPFFSTKPRDRGTGLGLATCYGIVMQAGGQIYAYSEPGQGTTFKIYLPRAERAAEELAPEPVAAASTRGRETLLLVEDDERVRRMAEKGLQAFGYTVLSAGTPAQALELAAAHADQLAMMITDVVMPETSGRALAEKIHARHPHVKVLYVSGYTENSVVKHGVLESGVHFLAKPFTPTVLAAKVREVLGEGPGPDPSRAGA